MEQHDRPAGPAPPRAPRPQPPPDILVPVLTAIFALVLGAIASRMEPDPAFTPLISSEDRLYYVTLIVLTLGTATAGVVTRPRTRSRASRPRRFLTPAIVLPTLAVAGAGLLFAYTTNWAVILLMAVSVGVVSWLATAVEGERANRRTAGLPEHLAPTIHLAVTIAVAVLVLSTVYGFRLSMRYTGPLVFLAAGVLLAQALAYAGTSRTIALVTITGAILVTEMAWVLLYWNIAAWHGGAILGLGLYTLLAIAGGQLSGGFDRRELTRQAMISAPIFVLLILAAR